MYTIWAIISIINWGGGGWNSLQQLMGPWAPNFYLTELL